MIIVTEYLFYITGVAKIVSMFNNMIVRERNSITITCEALGYPPPTIVWSTSKDVSDGVSMSDSVSVPTGYGNVTRVSLNLTIITALRIDGGNYICSANNSIGDDERNVSITVQCKLFVIL